MAPPTYLFEPHDFSRSCTSCARYISAPVHVITRLAALVARPKAHLVPYHEAFAPNARELAGIVARPKVASKAGGADECASTACSTPMSWMARLKQVFAVDLSGCPHCGGELQVSAAITNPGVISRTLEHLGLDGRVQPRSPSAALAN